MTAMYEVEGLVGFTARGGSSPLERIIVVVMTTISLEIDSF
jgi:hypothetical protein